MADYIEREALLKRVESRKLIFEENTPVEEVVAEQLSVFLEEIEETPAADVVEVVRCKDCKYFTQDKIADKIMDICVYFGGMVSIASDGFCSYGERREKQ